MEQYNASLPYDRLFYAQDIAGSIAFARANHANNILTDDEFEQIEKGLLQVKKEWEEDRFEIKANDEDIHTANERRLSEIVGAGIGGKLHTGRSRNEQIATDMRLWLREELRRLEGILGDLVRVSVGRAEKEIDVLVRFEHLAAVVAVCRCYNMDTNGLCRSPDIRIFRRPSQSAGRTGF